MDIAQLTAILESLICLALIIILLFSLLPTHNLVSFRQKMFELRDELFDFAAAGKIGFNDPAYRLLRQLMNGFIRYAHRLTFFSLCTTLLKVWAGDEKISYAWEEKWQGALKNIKDDSTRKEMEQFHAREVQLVAFHVVEHSPALINFLIFLVVAVLIQRGLHNLKELVTETSIKAARKVIDVRLLEEKAAAKAAA